MVSTSNEHNKLKCLLGGDKQTLQISHGKTQNAMSITFERTLRVPDNNNADFLPPSLGQFPLYSVAKYEKNLPEEMKSKGGLFLSMYQREGMSTDFEAPDLIFYLIID
jgi:hypothetical protein